MRFTSVAIAICTAALCAACGQPPSAPAESAQLPTANIAVPTPASAAEASPDAIRIQASAATPTLAPSATAPATPTTEPSATLAPQPTLAELPTAEAQPTATANDPIAMREAMLVVEINRIRTENNLPAYRANAELSAAARAHSCDLATHHTISHVSSDGRTLTDRLAGSTPAWEWPSESIAAGTDDPAEVVALWMDEPPDGWHRRNILDADQQEVGTGYCAASEDPSGNQFYWTADFARRAATQ